MNSNVNTCMWLSSLLWAVYAFTFFDMFYIQWHCLDKGIYGINKLWLWLSLLRVLSSVMSPLKQVWHTLLASSLFDPDDEDIHTCTRTPKEDSSCLLCENLKCCEHSLLTLVCYMSGKQMQLSSLHSYVESLLCFHITQNPYRLCKGQSETIFSDKK
jgi:hypothetical protein